MSGTLLARLHVANRLAEGETDQAEHDALLRELGNQDDDAGGMEMLQHLPVNPARAGLEREYLQEWLKFATRHPQEWHEVFTSHPVNPGQREATIAASFVVFMATSAGREFLQLAMKLHASKVLGSKEEAFLAAWGVRNARWKWMNQGNTYAEFMVSPPNPTKQQVQKLGGDDLAAIECMVTWWSGSAAEKMRERAEARHEMSTRQGAKGRRAFA